MGSASAYRHFSSIWKTQAQWIESSQIQDVITSGEYFLDQIELPSTGTKALRIPLGKDKGGNDFYYWVEYRKNLGIFDDEDAVEIRTKPDPSYDGTSWSDNSIIFKYLTPGGSISGRVTKDSDGVGIQNVLIYVYDSNWYYIIGPSTDSSGNYRVSGLPTGSYYLQTLNSLGYLDEFYNNVRSSSNATLVSVTQGSNTPNINFGLTLGGSISGRVTKDSDGTGIQNVWVYVYDSSWNWVKSASTDSSGNYTVGGLPSGSYYLQTWNNQGYIDEYYNNVRNQSNATLVSVTQGSNTPNINFGLTLGGSISGRVTKDFDGTGIQNVWVYVYDNSWNYVNDGGTDSSGNYTVGGLPSGSYYLQTRNNQGYIDEYYNNVRNQSNATLVSVTQGSNTPNINFGLTLGGSSARQSIRNPHRDEIRRSIGEVYGRSIWGRINYPETPGNPIMGGVFTRNSYEGISQILEYSNIDINKPFHDPYRGVKIELVEKIGSGSDSKTKLLVTLSGVNISPAEILNFGDIDINKSSSSLVRVTNNSTSLLSIGILYIGGRNFGLFRITNDGCSNKSLQQNGSCTATLSFSPDSEGDKFGVLVLPTSDSMRPLGSVSLYGYGNKIPDTTPPDTQISSGPSGTITYNNPIFTYTGSDNITPTANLVYATYLQGYDSGWSSFSSSTTKSYSNLPNGSYTFQVKAKDQAGNEDPTPATRAFTVAVPDTTPPDTSITSGPSGTITTNSATFTFTGSDNITPTANLVYATYLQGYDSGWSSFSSSTTKSYNNLPNGSYTFQVKAKDQTGNEDPTPPTRSFTVAYSNRCDFNGDGKTDILWRNKSTGQNVVWLMNGTTYSSYAELLQVADTNWQIVGTGDFNGDGKTDILWRNKSTGQNVVWYMNGATYSSYAEIMQVTDTNWQIVGTGDFNGDGKTDILWRNKSTGQNVVWFMNGVTYSSYAEIMQVTDTNWQIVGTGDFNSDGKVDILWRNKSTGQNIVWLMNGAIYSSYAELIQVTDTNWEIVGPK